MDIYNLIGKVLRLPVQYQELLRAFLPKPCSNQEIIMSSKVEKSYQ